MSAFLIITPLLVAASIGASVSMRSSGAPHAFIHMGTTAEIAAAILGAFALVAVVQALWLAWHFLSVGPAEPGDG